MVIGLEVDPELESYEEVVVAVDWLAYLNSCPGVLQIAISVHTI